MQFLNIKKNKRFYKKNTNKGQIVVLSVILFLFVSFPIVFNFISPVLREYKIAKMTLNSKKSYYTAESGAEDILYRIKKNKLYSDINEIETIDGIVNIEVLSEIGNRKIIKTKGNVINYINNLSLVLTTGTGINFNYGVQTGIGGLIMGSNSKIEGSVYSNGKVTGSGIITGSVFSANMPEENFNQANYSDDIYEIRFGNQNSTQDFAQSFILSKNEIINKIDLYIKKNGSPNNLNVKIVNDNNNSPGNTTIASGILYSSLVSFNDFGWVSVPFSSNPILEDNKTYWFILDGGSDSNNYYFIAGNEDGYQNGVGKIGRYNSSWNNLTPNLDGFFKIYLGGLKGLIDGITIGEEGEGNAYAYTITNSTTEGENYCKIGTGNNKSCNTSFDEPVQIVMPISEQNIEDWKEEALLNNDIYYGDFTADGFLELGPKKITGNLTLNNNAILTLTGTLWVEGNIIMNQNSKIKLSELYNNSSGVIICDGEVSVLNNGTFEGSENGNNYIMVLSTSSSSSAISLSQNGGSVILYAHNGTVNLANNATAKSLNGKYINLANNAIVIYEEGLINESFVNGPSGGWKIASWVRE